MTDPTPDPTPTRDEAVLKAADEMRECMQSARFGHTSVPTSMLAAWRQLLSRLASAPAPASGRVDVEALTYRVANAKLGEGSAVRCEGPTDFEKDQARAWVKRVLRALASLSPAATPVSEAEPVAWTFGFIDGEGKPRHGLSFTRPSSAEGYDAKPLFGQAYKGETEQPCRAALEWFQGEPEWWDTPREFRDKAKAALAKPASSPAPVRPIGNQGISDYQREIARNMAEGFAAWNAARQEALPSDEPAFSPAGGDVVEALKRIAEHPEKYDDGVQSYDVGFAFWNVQKIARNALAALSQSTSAGRVGE